ncbi:hypothetical protein PHLGIDRAFT_115338 [Phlebiopsis gigantea 11061_1 CR5-6]|uniref:Uncharacterized protein n=1 Tax=Phlebiopsis gigantea (strain 11061_1 CR5-6) TaxID=745531 RepID=A0A0C3S4B7_PHLG1|nr:hypothetical protein PHLGIDRAFT_115338 [Phlebiopsis gigantea 11061_1 CR5-6]
MSTGLLRTHLGNDQGTFVVQVLFLGCISTLLSSIVTAIIISRGHHTHFPASDPHLGWVSGPNSRGTLNIISACASTIFTCVYVSVHLDVPDRLRAAQVSAGWTERNNLRVPKFILLGFAAVWKRASQISFLRPQLWVLFNIVAPELIVVVAVLELLSARDVLRTMHKRGQEDWTMTLAFFADMGGYQLEDGHHLRNGLAFLEWFDSIQNDEEAIQLDVERIRQEIDDRSNAEPVLKLFTVVQATWFFIETFIRLGENKAISPLEAATCSYIVCAVIVYLCWLYKPYSVNGRIVLRKEMFLVIQKPSPSPMSPTQSPRESTSTMDNEPTDRLLDDMHSDVSQSGFPDVPTDTQHTTQRFISTLGGPELNDIRLQEKGTPSRIEPQDGAASLALSSLPHQEVHDEEVKSVDSPIAQISPLPVMLYENARHTPFNRSWVDPRKAWPLAYDVGGLAGCIIGLIHGVPLWNTLWINSTGQWLWRFACIVQISVPILMSLGMNLEKAYSGRVLLGY